MMDGVPADSKFSNQHITFESNSNRDIRFEFESNLEASQSLVENIVTLLSPPGSRIILVF